MVICLCLFSSCSSIYTSSKRQGASDSLFRLFRLFFGRGVILALFVLWYRVTSCNLFPRVALSTRRQKGKAHLTHYSDFFGCFSGAGVILALFVLRYPVICLCFFSRVVLSTRRQKGKAHLTHYSDFFGCFSGAG